MPTTSCPTETGALAERHAAIEARVVDACAHAGRARADVKLIAVSKRHPDDAVRELAGLGVSDFGESHVQAWLARLDTLEDLDLSWHLIGPLQTNKVKFIARASPRCLHTVDRQSLVDALGARLDPAAPLDCFIQVNVDREPQKAGCDPDELDALADAVAATSALRLLGLMCIPRPGDTRPSFARTRALSASIADRVAGPVALSMGMSDDFEDAIAEGSTHVRVGTALFGARA